MKLNETQMQALSDGSQREFEDRLIAHCRAYFPDQCHALGEDATRDVIRGGVERARDYGFRVELHVCLYINLLFTFGDGFDTSEDPAWPHAILNDESIQDPADRIARLCDAASEHLDRCCKA